MRKTAGGEPGFRVRKNGQDGLRRALIIVPAEHGTATTGDRVVIDHLLTFLQEHYTCEIVQFGRSGGARKIFNVLLYRLPLELSPYWQPGHRRRLRQILALSSDRTVFILHEGLFYLADEIDLTTTGVTLFAHNMLSRFTVDSIVQPILTALSRRYERRWYGKQGARLVLISQGDRDAAVGLGIAAPDAPVAPPGAPRASELADHAVFAGESVITGTYGWWRKRRDLEDFARFGAALKPIAFDARVGAVIPKAVVLPSPASLDWSSAIRAGLITDRFAGGFKLKSLEYIARNCIVFSRAPIFEDFRDLPYAADFIIDQVAAALWADRIANLRMSDQADLRRRFIAFKTACMARFSWTTCLEPLLPNPERPVAAPRPLGVSDRAREQT
jgi:hypothetical protein